ncbi:Uu.00g087520.m01.CDS01 [Anthostomella pinea]|uniref:Uu.00g087520.m01.CDS01 n=1 Tax=Anthostomella pinea TaxID=933095 RepID=A0AAI8VM99_9PEZI|nr:Uu.00g087520.m01.CDS01 [Anthostomella pinea]
MDTPGNATYRGDLNNPLNHSQDIPVEQSTSVFVSGLPGNCRPTDLLAQIRGMGKLYASNMIAPADGYATAAAKLVFWDRAGLDNFWRKWEQDQFTVLGVKPRVVMNRFYTTSKPYSIASRALTITGPSEVVNIFDLCFLFRGNFDFKLEDMVESQHGHQSTVLVLFASYRSQASAAWKVVRQIQQGREVMKKPLTIHGEDLEKIPLTPREVNLWQHAVMTWAADPSQ